MAEIDWAALKQLKDAGLSNADIRRLSASGVENQWSLPAAKYNPATGSYEGQGFTWTGEGPAPANGEGISDLFGYTWDQGNKLTQNESGNWNVGLTDEASANFGQPARRGGELVVGGGGAITPNIPVSAFPGGGNGTLGSGPKGVQGIDNTAPLAGLMPEKQGYESSSNKDFYQRQFQEMMGQQNGQKLTDLAAAMRRQEASAQPQGEAFGGDPWSWANLPEVQMGTGQTGGPAGVVQNPRYDWGADTNNAQILNDLRPLLGDTLGQFVDKNPIDDAPSLLDRNAFNEYLTTKNPNDKGFQAAWDKVLGNVYIPDPTTRGPSAPVGYASPLNAYGE